MNKKLVLLLVVSVVLICLVGKYESKKVNKQVTKTILQVQGRTLRHSDLDAFENSSTSNKVLFPTIKPAKRKPKNKKMKKRRNRRVKDAPPDLSISVDDIELKQTKHSRKVSPKKKKNLQKRKKKENRRGKKKSKSLNESNVLEITKMAKKVHEFSNQNVIADPSIRNVIEKLNTNPESSHRELLNFADQSKNIMGGYSTIAFIKKNKKSQNKTRSDFIISSTEDSINQKLQSRVNDDAFKYPNSPEERKYRKTTTDRSFSTNKSPLAISKELKETEVHDVLTGYEECGSSNGGCAHICKKTIYSTFKCSCLEGFTLSTDGRSCIDTDECSETKGGCEHLCHNIVGSYYCSCLDGFRAYGTVCEDINECLLRNGHGPCDDTCVNTIGSYACGCSNLKGTRLAKNSHTCEDLNECTDQNGGCSHKCINTRGRAFCACPDGMVLGDDWKTCSDINECEDKKVQKLCRYGCLNTVGSYRCIDPKSEQNDVPMPPKNISCPPLFPLKNGFFNCSRKKAAPGFKTKNGRFRITNRPGTYCELICPPGYKSIGVFRLYCGFDGRWKGLRQGKCIPHVYPEIHCPEPLNIEISAEEETVLVRIPPPRTNVKWDNVRTNPPLDNNLRTYFPGGHHWVTFTATDPLTNLTAKCFVYVYAKRSKQD